MLSSGIRIAAVLALVAATPALARLSPEAYRHIGVSLPADAAAPADLSVTDERGYKQTLGTLIAGPTVLVLADYTCTTLCGPVIAFVGAALDKSGLRAGKDFRLVVVGLDPRDGMADAARMRREHLGDDPGLARATTFVTADDAAVRRLTAALGYRYAYDAENDQYVHPAAAYVLRADRRVARVLTGLGLSGDDMRLALVEAGEGRVGTVRDTVRLLCSGFDPARGTYNLAVSRMLAASGLVTLLLLGGGIGCLVLAGRRRAA